MMVNSFSMVEQMCDNVHESSDEGIAHILYSSLNSDLITKKQCNKLAEQYGIDFENYWEPLFVQSKKEFSFQDGYELKKETEGFLQLIDSLYDDSDTIQRASDLYTSAYNILEHTSNIVRRR